jgi:hypothetical protein
MRLRKPRKEQAVKADIYQRITDQIVCELERERRQAVAQAMEYLGEVANDPGAISKLRDRLGRPGRPLAFVMRPDPAVIAFIGNSQASAIDAT